MSLTTRISLSAHSHVGIHLYILDDCLLYYSTDGADTPRIVVPHDEELKYRLFQKHMIVMLKIILVV